MTKELYIHAFNQDTGEFCVVKSEGTVTPVSNGQNTISLISIKAHLFGTKPHVVVYEDTIDKNENILSINTVSGRILTYVSSSIDVEKAKSALEYYICRQYWNKTTKIEKEIHQLNEQLKILYDQIDKDTDALLEGVVLYQTNMEEQNYELEAE